MSDPQSPDDGVSGKLKAVVYVLTGATLFAFAAFFTKLITKNSAPRKQEKFLANQRILELTKTGERLRQAGHIEQALDQYIRIWNLENSSPSTRAEAAFTAGKLYLKLENCKESLVWLFRSESANPDKTAELQPLIDSCIHKDK